MGRIIVKQPDGLYAVWSTVVDSFVMIDGTPDEIAEEFAREEAKQIRKRVLAICAELDSGGKPYYQLTYTWDRAQELHAEVHGKPFDLDEARKEAGDGKPSPGVGRISG